MNKKIYDLTGFNFNFEGRLLPSQKNENNIIVSLKWVANSPPTFFARGNKFQNLHFYLHHVWCIQLMSIKYVH